MPAIDPITTEIYLITETYEDEMAEDVTEEEAVAAGAQGTTATT